MVLAPAKERTVLNSFYYKSRHFVLWYNSKSSFFLVEERSPRFINGNELYW